MCVAGFSIVHRHTGLVTTGNVYNSSCVHRCNAGCVNKSVNLAVFTRTLTVLICMYVHKSVTGCGHNSLILTVLT